MVRINKRSDKNRFILTTAAIILILDIVTKILIRKYIAVGQSVQIIDKILYFTHLNNTGAGFSLFAGYNSLFILIYLTALAAIIYNWKDIPGKRWPMFFIALILAGIIGNLIDRVVYSSVTDFIDFRIWPVFNIADSGISIGILGFIFYEILSKKKS